MLLKLATHYFILTTYYLNLLPKHSMVNFQTYEARRDYLLELISKKYPLSRKQLATKFGCEERSISRMINDLRYHKNYNIHYSRQLRRYTLLSGPFKKN